MTCGDFCANKPMANCVVGRMSASKRAKRFKAFTACLSWPDKAAYMASTTAASDSKALACLDKLPDNDITRAMRGLAEESLSRVS